jgi:hypothetical protein
MAFELAVNNYDRSRFGTVGFWMVYVFFLFASVMVLIVMMNLLISIVSDSFSEMAGTAEVTLYQEVCEVIDDAYSMVQTTHDR